MALVYLIYCAAGSTKYGPIAVEEGYLYGCRSDGKPSQDRVSFVDINWRKISPEYLDHHIKVVYNHKPLFAVAPDIEDLSKFDETLHYARQLAKYSKYVIIVPKAEGVVDLLPREDWIVVGYSVPSKYAGADLIGMWDLQGWSVHLLGGSPQAQLHIAHYLNVVSVDGNAAQGAAAHGVFFSSKTGEWVSRSPEVPIGPDLPYRAFRRSCQEIKISWKRLGYTLESEGSGTIN